jgi:hypothetical protein
MGTGRRIAVKQSITVTVNGRNYEASVEPRLLLSDFLRDTLGLTGTHVGCEHGVCGACTILILARSPLGNPAGVTFGQRVSAPPSFLKSSGPQAPWARTAGQSARPQAHAAIENFPSSQPFVFNRILP